MHKLGSLENGEELLALASGSDQLATYYQGCVVNGVRFIAVNRDKNRTTQNSGVSAAGTEGFDYYGTLEDIITLSFTGTYVVTLFKCKWFNTNPTRKRTVVENNITSINVNGEWYKDEPFILGTQANQVFYIDDLLRGRNWKVVEKVDHRQIWDIGDDIEASDDIDFVHDTNSTDFVLTVELGDLILISDQPATDAGINEDIDDSQTVVENDEVEDVDDDELLVEYCDDENCNPIDGNDSDYSL